MWSNMFFYMLSELLPEFLNCVWQHVEAAVTLILINFFCLTLVHNFLVEALHVWAIIPSGPGCCAPGRIFVFSDLFTSGELL